MQMKCSYAAIDNKGNRTTGAMESMSRDEAIESLHDKKLIVTKISCGAQVKGQPSLVLAKEIRLFPAKISSVDLMIFTRELATMVGAGLPLVESLYTLGEDVKNPKLRKVVHSLGSDLIGGKSFTDALKRFPEVFDRMFINLIKVGEIGGQLEKILNSLAQYIEDAESLKRRVMSAMYYPATVLLFAFVVVSGMFIFIIPRFAEIYSSFGGELPLLTSVFLNASLFARRYYPLIFAGIVLSIYLFRSYIKTSGGRMWFDKLKLTLPLVGPLINMIIIARFARILALLYSSGVAINESLDLVAAACGNAVVEEAILKANDLVLEGEGIAGTLEKSKVFPHMVIHMMDVGERTGNLSEMLTKISEFYNMQVNAAVRGLTSIIEPVLVVTMGVLIGFTALSLFLPIVKLPTLIN